MPVIIKDFQVLAEKPESPAPAAPEKRRSTPAPPPTPKKLAQTLNYIKKRLGRVHAD